MKIDRLISIIMILLDKNRISAQELADTFEVSQRTIYRDIDSINMAGIPVLSVPGVGGGFEIMEKYKIDKKVFSTADLSTLLMGLSSLNNIVRGDEIVNAIAKVKSFIPPEKTNDITLLANQIYVDLNPWTFNRNIQQNLETIKGALNESKLLSFEYLALKGNISSRIIEPYQLVLKNSQWYLQGYCLKRNDYRLFKLSRITNLQIRDEYFIPRNYQKPVLEFSEILKPMQIRIKLRIHKDLLDRILDYCSFEDFYQEDNDYYIVNFPFIENEYYYSILISFGANCECLEPLEIRAGIKSRINDIAKIY